MGLVVYVYSEFDALIIGGGGAGLSFSSTSNGQSLSYHHTVAAQGNERALVMLTVVMIGVGICTIRLFLII